jgi:hypothetical protein
MRRRKRRNSNLEIDLGLFSDILTNVVGVLFFLTLLIALQVSQQKKVTILAKTEKGENTQKNPLYIECRQDGVFLYPSQELVPLNRLQDSNSQFKKLIERVKKNQNSEYLIVAVKPDGISVFQQVRNLVENEKINIGYEPIDSGWKLNLDGNIVNDKKSASP